MSTFFRCLLLTLLALGTLPAAGDPDPSAPGQDSTTPPPSGSAPEAPKKPAPTPTPAPTPAPTPTADPEEQLEEFIPTEDLPADEAVAFPVDI